MYFGGIHTHGSSSARISANQAAATARGARTDVQGLQYEVERLLMITEALWTLMKKEHGYEDLELIRRITEIDMRDGKLDGRVAKSRVAECPKCKHVLSKKHHVCIYCGTAVVQDPFVR